MDSVFECSVCLDVFTAPMTTRCGHSFCNACVRQVRRCPLCQSPVSYDECVPNYQLQAGVEALHPDKRDVVYERLVRRDEAPVVDVTVAIAHAQRTAQQITDAVLFALAGQPVDLPAGVATPDLDEEAEEAVTRRLAREAVARAQENATRAREDAVRARDRAAIVRDAVNAERERLAAERANAATERARVAAERQRVAAERQRSQEHEAELQRERDRERNARDRRADLFRNYGALEDMDGINRLLADGMSLEERDYAGRTLLLRSFGPRPFDGALVRALLNRGADATAIDTGGNTAMHLAAGHSRFDVIVPFLGVHPIDTLNVAGHTALAVAVKRSTTRIVRWLIQHGASPNVGHLLHVAACRTSFDFCRIFLPDMQVDSLDDEGRTPLMLAVHCGGDRVVAGLLEAGASLVARDHRGRTALHWFFGTTAETLAKTEFEGLVPWRFPNVSHARSLPIILAHPRIRELIDEVDDRGHTALAMAACCVRSQGVFTSLLEASVAIDRADGAGRTPLHHAAKVGNVLAVRLLVAAGARKDATDAVGKTPIDYAGAASLKRALA